MRRKLARLSFFHSLYHSSTPFSQLHIIPPPHISARIDHTFKVKPIFAKTERYKNSPLVLAIAEWNALPAHIAELSDSSSFQHALKTFLEVLWWRINLYFVFLLLLCFSLYFFLFLFFAHCCWVYWSRFFVLVYCFKVHFAWTPFFIQCNLLLFGVVSGLHFQFLDAVDMYTISAFIYVLYCTCDHNPTLSPPM